MEADRHGIKLQPGRQCRAICEPCRNGRSARQIGFGQRAQHGRLFEEDHITIRLYVIAKGFGRNDIERLILQPFDKIIAQDRAFVARQDRDRHESVCSAAVAVADIIFKTSIAVEISAWPEFNLAVGIDPHLAVLGKAVSAGKDQRITIFVAIIGKQARRINEENLILKRPETIIILGNRGVVKRPHLEIIGKRC